MTKLTKNDINKIKELRLDGWTLEEISDYFDVHKTTITMHLKRKYDISFWQLPKRCRCCNKVFVAEDPNHKYCSKKCYINYRLGKEDGFGFIYQIKNVVNGKRYIGATTMIKKKIKKS